MTPEQDQSIVTQCKVYRGTGEITVCHKSVMVVTNDTTKAIVLTGEGILEDLFKIRAIEKKKSKLPITTVNGIDWGVTSISKVGPLVIGVQMNKLWGTPAKESSPLTILACQIQKLKPWKVTTAVRTRATASPIKKCIFWNLKFLEIFTNMRWTGAP